MSNPQQPSIPQQPPIRDKGVVVLKWWQLIIAAVVVVALSVGMTITVGMVIRDNEQRSATAEDYKKPEKAEPQQKEEPKTSSRGNLIKHIGDVAGISASAGSSDLIAQWTVKNIIIDAPCTPAYEGASTTPSNGHFVMLDIEVETTSEFDSRYGQLALGSPAVWTYIEKDGTQWNGNLDGTIDNMPVYSCIPDNERLPGTIGQGVKAEGKVMLDVPSTDGYLVYKNGANGWEYPLS
ncbi:hypothetical protein [Bifidobacterium olomucense]|uniref:DUF4352 domain-containing protein n=1 Tax=Bifidobacterium olomucense TaxID=2675324 RepID=A0A7Y0EX77_9BIFI|nr:hypothetical protein [Bifidobacterium sp. DSM 109959]NMM98080.1 hypothetical protein [Bifidobacterium sp. DSM 109959]